LWRGLATENITQAIAHDLLRHSLRSLPNVVLHVHDEVVIECETDALEQTVRTMQEVMCTPPSWAKELPLKIGLKTMQRYGK
jgi:DNA polymerase I-like protein with 3'-5' exonuclease and polymerase domains